MEHEKHGRSCIVIELNPKISEEAVSWFISRVKSNRQDHGCQLQITCNESDSGTKILMVTASDTRLRIGAEIFGIQKQHSDGNMRDFCISDEHNFVDYEDEDFIADCESLYIIKTELDSLRAVEEKHIPVRKMKSSKLFKSILCLHDSTKLDKLAARWYKSKSLLAQPIDEIRAYFGDAIAKYFSFLAYYTKALIPLIALTLIFFLVSDEWGEVYSYSVFAVVNMIWATMFLEMWKRKSAEVAYKFGSFQKREWEDPRNGYHGPLGLNAITGKQEPQYPSWKRRLRMCLITFPWDYHFAQKYDHDPAISSKIIRNLPSVAYSCLVLIANSFYRALAQKLTDQENHRLESSYQNHLILKLVLFDFVNNFLCLFYIAFIYEDVKMLRRTLRNLFLVQIVVSQTIESVVPYLQYRRRISTKHEGKESGSTISQVEADRKRDVYMGTFDDYLEMWLQFGYVVLFSSVFPMAAVWAFLNNIVEIKSDAFKLCTSFRRPFCFPTRNIGAWQTRLDKSDSFMKPFPDGISRKLAVPVLAIQAPVIDFALDAIAYLGVVTNCALLFQSPALQKWFYKAYPEATGLHLLMLFFIVEHILLILRAMVCSWIPNIPEKVRINIASVQYKSQQALKRKRAASLRPTEGLAEKLSSLHAMVSNDEKNEFS